MSTQTLDGPRVFRNVKETPAVLLILILFSELGLNWLYLNVLYGALSVPVLYTRNLVQPLFLLSFLKGLFIVAGIVFWIGRFNAKELGIQAKNLKMGILSTFFLWALIQIALIGWSSLQDQGIVFLNSEGLRDTLILAGSFLLFAVTKAFFDEVVYRALLISQVYFKIERYVDLPARAALVFAVIISQSIYLIIQMPLINAIDTQEIGMLYTILTLLFVSVFNALIYLRTRNLYVSIGIHTLWYYPVFVVEAPMPHYFILAVFVIGLIVIWPMLPTSGRPVHKPSPLHKAQRKSL